MNAVKLANGVEMPGLGLGVFLAGDGGATENAVALRGALPCPRALTLTAPRKNVKIQPIFRFGKCIILR